MCSSVKRLKDYRNHEETIGQRDEFYRGETEETRRLRMTNSLGDLRRIFSIKTNEGS
jgi:hypothetical protein